MKQIYKKIISACIEINDKKNYQVFLNVSPHTQGIEIYVYEGEWSKEKDGLLCFSIYYEGNLEDEEKAKNYLKQLKKYLV